MWYALWAVVDKTKNADTHWIFANKKPKPNRRGFDLGFDWRRRRDSPNSGASECTHKAKRATKSSATLLPTAFYAVESLSPKQKSTHLSAIFVAEKKRFELLNRFWRLRDFQSRALDQTRRLLRICNIKLKLPVIIQYLYPKGNCFCSSKTIFWLRDKFA